jgi:hypothetical protein
MKKVLGIIAIVAMIITTSIPALAGRAWKDIPIWEIDGARVDIGFLYDEACVNGPIAYEIVYPAEADEPVLIETDEPPYGYTVTLTPNANFQAGANHIDLRVKATIPSAKPLTPACSFWGASETGVRIRPISDRFDADTDHGRYNELMIASAIR